MLIIDVCKLIYSCGVSGAGKTTIVKLLLRLYDCQSGAVEVGGEPVTQYNIAALRSQFALVSQVNSYI
jgi:ABC-type multidrug transport system fused ATPase/permease subunit